MPSSLINPEHQALYLKHDVNQDVRDAAKIKETFDKLLRSYNEKNPARQPGQSAISYWCTHFSHGEEGRRRYDELSLLVKLLEESELDDIDRVSGFLFAAFKYVKSELEKNSDSTLMKNAMRLLGSEVLASSSKPAHLDLPTMPDVDKIGRAILALHHIDSEIPEPGYTSYRHNM